MENVGCGGRGGGQRTNYHQVGTLLMLIIFTTHFHSADSERNVSLTWFPEGPQPWNKTLYKTQRNCLDFRGADWPPYFYYWPEDDFDHCCSFNLDPGAPLPPGQLVATNFTDGVYGPVLEYMIYYDLGLIDKLCLPYWRCRRLYYNLYKTYTFQVPCERTDLQRLYVRRFWRGCVLNYGILQSALPAILSLETLVFLFALYCVWRQDVEGSKKDFMIDASKTWFKAMHKAVLMVWIHLCLLAIVGNGIIEAIGRQSAYSSQSKSYYNYGRLYIWLSVFVWFSSFLQQLSFWIAVIDDSETVQASQLPGPRSEVDLQRNQTICLNSSVLEELEDNIGLTDDWIWQLIVAQAGILFCLWGYLTYTDDEGKVAAVFFGIIVQAAAPWSGLYAVKITFNTLPWLLKRIYSKLISWWRGRRRRQHDYRDPESQEVPLAGVGLQRSDTP